MNIVILSALKTGSFVLNLRGPCWIKRLDWDILERWTVFVVFNIDCYYCRSSWMARL